MKNEKTIVESIKCFNFKAFENCPKDKLSILALEIPEVFHEDICEILNELFNESLIKYKENKENEENKLKKEFEKKKSKVPNWVKEELNKLND